MEYNYVNIFIMNWYNYFKELHNEQEYYWPTMYRLGAAVVSTITSLYIFAIYKIMAAENGHFALDS